TGIGFNLANGVSLVNGSFNNTGFLDTLIENASLPPFGTFDIGIADNNNFQGGNAQQALPEGGSTTASLLLSTTSSASDVEQAFLDLFSDDSNFVARFQSVNAGAGSDKLLGGIVSANGSDEPEPVPEPFTILGSMAALGVGTVLKRKANKA
ncbi:MAG: PEP-CTERM sorting domain-containing protein, partial [Cyanobacteriota bacterium]|nr:PEP-CTERM sorting domain-containing protein [Cyanobacteriota bacterium]